MKNNILHIKHKQPGLLRHNIAVAFLMLPFITAGQSWSLTTPEYQVKSVFLYNFTHFVEWPRHAYEAEYAPFIIGIIGDDPFGSYLDQTIAQERTGTHLIRVVRFKSIADIGACHILYIAVNNPEEIRRTLRAVEGRPILTIADTPNFTRWGGMIRFYTEAGKIRLQINNTAAKAESLRISSKLLRVSDVL